MAICKVSCVVIDNDHPGAILSMNAAPKAGDIIKLGIEIFEVIEVMELLPPRGEFHYYHATCKLKLPASPNL